MSKAPIMPFYTDAYLADTLSLTTEGHGAYLLLLLYSWRNNGIGPKDNDELLARITGTTPARWKKMRPMLASFFDVSSGVWRQKKLEMVWREVEEKLSQQKEKSKLAHQAKSLKKQETDLPAGMPVACPSINHEPLSMNQIHDPSSIHHNAPSANDEKNNKQTIKTPALDSLMPMLKDKRFTMKSGDGYVSREMLPVIASAEKEVRALLSPIPQQALRAVLGNCFAHFASNEERKRSHELLADYRAELAAYPHDAVEAAYLKLKREHKFHFLPKIADFILHITPEVELRRSYLSRLARLREKAGVS